MTDERSTHNSPAYDVCVIGGGAAGMMAAISAAELGVTVVVLEKNPYLGKKLRITGKGRCNVTNNSTVQEMLEAVRTNSKFLYGAINRFTPADTMEFFEDCGVRLKTERGRRVFPVSDSATEIRDAMEKRMRELGVRVICSSTVTSIDGYDGDFTVNTSKRSYSARSVIIASGGVSYPGTGSTGDGHRILSEMGVEITPLSPSLVPIVTEEDFSDIMGLSLKNVTLTVRHGKETAYSELGEMLFTHFGVSGPLVLSASANMQKHPIDTYTMSVNLKPALTTEELDRRVIGDLRKYATRDFINSLGDLLPQKLIPWIVQRSEIDPRKKSGEITREERARLVSALSDFKITPESFRPIDEAIITSGGVAVREISPKTMELKAIPGIFVCGEIIDVDAYTGGYNLQIAFSTARAAGISAAYR
ncbi:MAG: NAD(P)/FAD-dependent oxidoreductase [Clostridia bacterium]|nr:NAD(P)/FAD-dependent oxidoreductase [Clostridia bacterium]